MKIQNITAIASSAIIRPNGAAIAKIKLTSSSEFATIGELVGNNDGEVVGINVGDLVGETEGERDGDKVGDIDCENVGAKVGDNVGALMMT